MNLALCAFALIAVATCSAQQSDLVAPSPRYRIAEATTISIGELQQRSQSKARGIFGDAKIAARQGDHARAVKLFDKTLKIDPQFSDARNDLAVELIILGETNRGIEELRKTVDLDPHFIMAYTNLGALLCNEKKYLDAELVLRRAVSINPSSAKANLLLALSLYGQGKRGSETQSALEVAARSNPIAVKLLKQWYGISDVAEASTAH